MDEKAITIDHINALLRIYPENADLVGLMEEVRESPPDEKWDRAEEYFIALVDDHGKDRGLKLRLSVWQFKKEFFEKFEAVKVVLGRFKTAF